MKLLPLKKKEKEKEKKKRQASWNLIDNLKYCKRNDVVYLALNGHINHKDERNDYFNI